MAVFPAILDPGTQGKREMGDHIQGTFTIDGRHPDLERVLDIGGLFRDVLGLGPVAPCKEVSFVASLLYMITSGKEAILLRDHLVVGCDSLKVVTLVRIQVPQHSRIFGINFSRILYGSLLFAQF